MVLFLLEASTKIDRENTSTRWKRSENILLRFHDITSFGCLMCCSGSLDRERHEYLSEEESKRIARQNRHKGRRRSERREEGKDRETSSLTRPQLREARRYVCGERGRQMLCPK